MKLKVKRFTVLEGPLYQMNGEDGPMHVFDSEVVAIAEDGNTFGRGYTVKGFGVSTEPDYPFVYPNQNYREDCLGLILRLSKEYPEIDLNQGWYLIPQPRPLEERLKHEAEIEDAERQGEYGRFDTSGNDCWCEANYMMETM